MKIMLGGALKEGEFSEGLRGALERLGHAVLTPRKSPVAECEMLAAFVDDLTPELVNDIQDAIEADKPVLCLTDGRLPVVSPFLVAACQTGHIELAHYRDFDDLADKVLKFAKFVSKRNVPKKLHS